MARRLLTSTYVNRVQPTRRGERWIADTKVRGFGLRVWPQGKSFAIRTKDQEGRSTRRTICEARGYLLEDAREQAVRELRRLKGSPTIPTVREVWALKLPTLTVNQWVEKVLAVKEREKASKAYRESVHDLYARFAEDKIGRIKLADLTIQDVVETVQRASATPGQARKLQSFLHQVLSFAGVFYRHAYDLSWQLSERHNYIYDPHPRPKLKLRPKDFIGMFRRLVSEREQRQAALLLLFIFFTAVRPKEATRARWDQIRGNRFYPVRVAQWRAFADSTEVKDDFAVLISEIRKWNQTFDSQSPYLFPSRKAVKSGHITGYQRYWQKIRVEFEMPEVPLYYLVRHFRNPWYFQMRDNSFSVDTLRSIIEAEMTRTVPAEDYHSFFD